MLTRKPRSVKPGVAATAYMLANGQAKRCMTRDGTARSAATWSLLFLSTGEIGLADKLRESKRSGGRVIAGQQVRVLDLPADAGAGNGVFDHLAGFTSGQALADHLKAAAATHYGHPLRAYMRRLIEERPFDCIKRFVEAFVAGLLRCSRSQLRADHAKGGSTVRTSADIRRDFRVNGK